MLHSISLSSIHPGQIPAFAVAQNLQDCDAGPSEWYMYAFLIGVSHIKQKNPFTITATDLRRGVPGEFPPIRMSLNTIKSSLEELEKCGLVGVTREESGVSVLLHISLR